jgi:hypothetical protein
MVPYTAGAAEDRDGRIGFDGIEIVYRPGSELSPMIAVKWVIVQY